MMPNPPRPYIPHSFTLFCLRCRTLGLHNCDLLRIIREEIRTGAPQDALSRNCNNCRKAHAKTCSPNASSKANPMTLYNEASWNTNEPALDEEYEVRNAVKIQREQQRKPCLPSLFPESDEFPNWPDETPLELNATGPHINRPLRLPAGDRQVAGRQYGNSLNYRGRNPRYRGGYHNGRSNSGWGGTHNAYQPHNQYPGPSYGYAPYAFGGQYDGPYAFGGQHVGPYTPVPTGHEFRPDVPFAHEPQQARRDQRTQEGLARLSADRNTSPERVTKRTRPNDGDDTSIGAQAIAHATRVGTATDLMMIHTAENRIDNTQNASDVDRIIDTRNVSTLADGPVHTVAGLNVDQRNTDTTVAELEYDRRTDAAKMARLELMVYDLRQEVRLNNPSVVPASNEGSDDEYTLVDHANVGRGRGTGRGNRARGGRGGRNGGRGGGRGGPGGGQKRKQ